MRANARIQEATRLRRFSAPRRFRWAINLRRRVESPRLDTRFRGYDTCLHSYSCVRQEIERLFLGAPLSDRRQTNLSVMRTCASVRWNP